jgi:hypothetical protein
VEPLSVPTRTDETEPGEREGYLREAEAELQGRFETLEKLTGELADQRLCITEQCARLVQAQQRWQQERDAAVAELERHGQRLHERERALAPREQALEVEESRLRHQKDEAARLRRHLEGWQTRLAAQAAGWEGERGRLLADLQAREELVERQLAALADLRQHWEAGQQQQTELLQRELAACEALRHEYTALQEDYCRRLQVVDQQQREAAQGLLSLEQYRQETVDKAADSAAAERRLDRLRRRWAAHLARSEQMLSRVRGDLESEAARQEVRLHSVERQAKALAERRAELARLQAAWEERQMLTESTQGKLRLRVLSLQQQRDRYEQQLQALRDEVERLARLLMEEEGGASLSVVQAA